MKSNCFNYPRSAQVINTNTTQVRLWLLNSTVLYAGSPTAEKWGKHQHKRNLKHQPVIVPLLGRCRVLIRFRNDGLEQTGRVLSSFAAHPYLAFRSVGHSRIIINEENPKQNPLQPLQEQKANARIKDEQTRGQVWLKGHRSLERAFLAKEPSVQGGLPLVRKPGDRGAGGGCWAAGGRFWRGGGGHISGSADGNFAMRPLLKGSLRKLAAYHQVPHICKAKNSASRCSFAVRQI